MRVLGCARPAGIGQTRPGRRSILRLGRGSVAGRERYMYLAPRRTDFEVRRHRDCSGLCWPRTARARFSCSLVVVAHHYLSGGRWVSSPHIHLCVVDGYHRPPSVSSRFCLWCQTLSHSICGHLGHRSRCSYRFFSWAGAGRGRLAYVVAP